MPQLFFISILFFTFLSCNDEYGCLDQTAANYNNTAVVDDNTCYYEISGVLYWNKNLCYFQSIGVTELSITIDGTPITENLDLSEYHPCNPINISEKYNCEENEMSFPTFNSKAFTYSDNIYVEIFDQHQARIKSFLVNIQEEELECNSIFIQF